MHDATPIDSRTVHIAPLDAIPGAVLARAVPAADRAASWEASLHPDERALAAQIPPARRHAFVAGRVVLRHALVRSFNTQAGAPVLRTARGAPAFPAGVAGSISHKPTLAVALVAPVRHGHVATIGIDVEERRHAAPFRDIAKRILTANELQLLPASIGADRYDTALLFFAAKEAIYKAIDPFVQRHVRFTEVELAPITSLHENQGDANVSLSLPELRDWHHRIAVRWWREPQHVFAIAKVY